MFISIKIISLPLCATLLDSSWTAALLLTYSISCLMNFVKISFTFGCAGVSDVCRLPLVQVVGWWGYSSLWCMHFSLQWLLELWSRGFRHRDFSSYGLGALEHVLSNCLFAPWHSGIFPDQDQTHVLCTGRQILIHCNNREFLCSLKIIEITLFSLYF